MTGCWLRPERPVVLPSPAPDAIAIIRDRGLAIDEQHIVGIALKTGRVSAKSGDQPPSILGLLGS
jgi:hypothetical protein